MKEQASLTSREEATRARLTSQTPVDGLHQDVKDACAASEGNHKCYVRIIEGVPVVCGICDRNYASFSRVLKCKRGADECLYCHHEDHFAPRALPPCRRGRKKKAADPLIKHETMSHGFQADLIVIHGATGFLTDGALDNAES